MKNNTGRIAVLCVLALVLTLGAFSCERGSNESSRVSLMLPTYSDMSSLACTKCLKAVIVNIDGAGFPTLKYFNKMAFNLASAELLPEVVFDVPSGPARKIQILGIYRLSDGTFEAQYGSVITDIFGLEPPPIVLTLNNLGLFKTGSIAGRYLTGSDTGPTGKVVISINHASGLNMDLFDAEILNGWFDFFMSENFLMSYRLADGTPLGVPLVGLQNQSLDSLIPASAGVAAPVHMARVHRPSTYYRSTNGGWTIGVEAINEFHDIIYGYFGDAAIAATKYVCLDDAGPTVLPRMSSTGASADITYNYNNNTIVANSVYTVGGIGITSGGASCSGDSTSYSNNRITINRAQFDGMGNDTAKAIGGAFTYALDAGSVKKYLKTVSIDTNFSFKGLPNMFALTNTLTGALFDGVKLFIKPSTANGGGYDHIICTAEWLSLNGFTEFTGFSSPPAVVGTDVLFSINTTTLSVLTAPSVSSGFILCPTKLGVMTGYGGLYAGGLQ